MRSCAVAMSPPTVSAAARAVPCFTANLATSNEKADFCEEFCGGRRGRGYSGEGEGEEGGLDAEWCSSAVVADTRLWR